MSKRNEWQKEWIKLRFPEHCKLLKLQEALDLKKNHLPKSLYQYKPINDHTLENLRKEIIWFSNPLDFNDPYDCEYCLIANRDSNVSDDYNNGLQEMINGYIGKTIEDTKKTVEIACFTTKYDDMIMWSHYADKHKGICIEYDTSNFEEESISDEYLFPVIYSNKLIDMRKFNERYIEYQDENKRVEKYIEYAFYYPLIRKSKVWEYEQEWRFVYKYHQLLQRRVLPKRIYFGTKISKSCGDKIINTLKERGVEFYIMEKEKLSFGLTSHKINTK